MSQVSVSMIGSGPPAMSRSERWRVGGVIALWCAALAAMSPAAFRIDEPNILALARQIARAPLDPYGFAINWNGTTQPAWNVLANPPLVPAFLAGWASLFGWSEVSLHLSIIPISVLALLAMGGLARRVGMRPLHAIVLMIASPAFVLGSQVVMPDVAMLACLIASVASALRIGERRGMALLAGSFAFLAPLVKYNGIVAAPILLVLAIERFRSRDRRAFATLLVAAMPAVALTVWSVLGWLRYGTPHLIALHSLQSGALNPLPGMIAAFGLGILPLAVGFGLGLPRLRAAEAGVVGIVGFLVAQRLLEYPTGSSLLYGLACALTTAFLLQIDRRDAMLWTWLLVPMFFQFGQRFTAVRYLIATLPPAILFFRSGPRWRAVTAFAASLVLVIALSIADAGTANLYREFVAGHPTPRFSGHWGLQHYAGAKGATPVEAGERPVSPVLIALHAFPPWSARGQSFPRSIGSPLRTVDCHAAANFYGDAIANCEHYPIYLPFGFSRGEVETFVITSAIPIAAKPQPSPPSNASDGTATRR